LSRYRQNGIYDRFYRNFLRRVSRRESAAFGLIFTQNAIELENVEKLSGAVMNGTVLRIAIAIGLGFLPLSSFAHHSAAAFYETGTMIELEGVVTEFRWANPHVRFTLRTDDGESWAIESNSVSILRRMDLGPDVIKVGERLKVAGFAGRNGSKSMFVHNALLPDGEEVLMQPGAPARWSDRTIGTSKVWSAGGTATEGETPGIFRVWSSILTKDSNPGTFWHHSYPLTAAARAAVAAFDPVKSNPLRGCAYKGMPWIMEQPYPLEFVRQGDDIVLRMEEHDTVRTIHMQADRVPDGVEPSLLGYSMGRWDGSSLRVTTAAIKAGTYFYINGIQLSGATRMDESFTPSADGSRLQYEITITDPATFTEPVTLTKDWLWHPGEIVRPYECTE
jgi:Family of unknown function (DUF6152)